MKLHVNNGIMKNIFILSIFICSICTFSQSDTCNGSFKPLPGEKYILSAWVKDDVTSQKKTYDGYINIVNGFVGDNGNPDEYPCIANGPIIDGWQQITQTFSLKPNTTTLDIQLVPMEVGSGISYFDDIRIFPYNGNLKSFVYDIDTQRLMAELDENNFATLYEYDKEGGLVRVKKETERGIYTIQETRSGTSTLNAD